MPRVSVLLPSFNPSRRYALYYFVSRMSQD
jgi:hypothetical protein